MAAGSSVWFVVGCHGGAGTTTLQQALLQALPGAIDGGRYWPLPGYGHANVVLAARAHASGLRAAQTAARQWADRQLPDSIRLHGLAVIADAPGRRPKPLRELLQLISGGVPQLWELPWVEDFRLGGTPAEVPLPAAYQAMITDLQRITGESP
ncbi:DUF6668 family protein [Actinomadura kijaniata]|uniref:DUF6668 family protein n=1 Tax=Actinomadura kijaniata TaxID=46161 RepID=UPI003F194BFC